MPEAFDVGAVDQLVPTRFVQSCYSSITLPGVPALYMSSVTKLMFREAVATAFMVDVDLVSFHNATAAGATGGVPIVAIEYSVHSDEDVQTVAMGSPKTFERAFESAVASLHAAGHSGATWLPHFPASFNKTRCKEVLPKDQVWCGFNATAARAGATQIFTEIGLTVLVNATEVQNAAAGATLAAFEQDLITQLTQTTALTAALTISSYPTITVVMSKVFEIGECHQGLEIDQSSRMLRTPCSGHVGQICKYECKYGYNAFGSHVCGADGVFAGGICAPLGQVPLSCNGNIRVIPSSTVSSMKLAESSGSQHRAFLQREEMCQTMPQQSGCATGGCAPLEPNV